MLIVFCTIFVGASYAVAAPTARFLELNGFEDNSTNEKQFTANDFAGTYSRFMELSRSGHLCPKSLELLSNGVLKSDGSVQIQHVDAKLNNKRCISDGSLSFHFGRRLEKSFIENQLKLPRESNGIEAVIRNIVFQLKNFYYAVETQHIECGGASLFSGTVLLFTSDSEVFGRALQIPWSGHPRIAFLRDRQKSCAFNGTWLPQREGPIPIKSPAPVSLESSPSSMENEDTTAVPTEKPDFISSPAPPESDVSEANPTVTTVPPSSSAAISSTSAVKTSATAPSSSTKKRPPPPRRKVPASSGSRGPPPTSTIPFTTTSKTTSSGTATVTTPSSSLSSDSMTSATTISGTTTTVTSTAGMTTSAIATSSTGAAKKEPSATFPTSTTTQDVTTTVPESSASTAGTATEATPTSSATTSTMGTPTSTAGTFASTVFAPSATTKSPVTTIATMTTGVGPTFSTIIVTTLPTGTPVTTASSATNSPASVSSTRPTVSSTVTNAPVTPQPEATSLNVTDSNNPDPPVAPGTDNSFQTSSPVTASTVAASVTSPKSLPPTTSRTISPTVTPTTPVTTPTGGSSTTAGIFSSPKPSIPAGPGEQVNASVEHGSPISTKGPILFGDKEIPSPSDLLEESPMPSLSPGGNETIPMPSTDAPVSPLPSKSIEPSPPPRQNSGASDESSDGSTCFPAHVLVKLSTGQKIRMDNIDTGDVVFVGEGQTSKVVGFTHSDRHAISKFVRFTTDSGKVLEVTSTHFVYTQRGLAQAGKVTKSDFLQLEEGRMTKVITIDSVLARGLFNPHTVSGDIVVNDFVTSTYTTAVDPSIAHALLAPIRVLEGLGTKTSIVTMLSGNPWIVCMARRFFSGDLS